MIKGFGCDGPAFFIVAFTVKRHRLLLVRDMERFAGRRYLVERRKRRHDLNFPARAPYGLIRSGALAAVQIRH